MTENLKKIVGFSFSGIFLLLLGAALGRDCAGEAQEAEKNVELVKQLSELREKHEGVVMVMNDEITDLQVLIDSKDEDVGLLSDLVLSLSDVPTKVKYVVKTVTVTQPIAGPTVFLPISDLPEERLIGIKSSDGKDIVVEKFESFDEDGDGIPDRVKFTPYRQNILLDGAIGEESSTFILTMESEYDNQPHPLAVVPKVTRVGGDTKTDRKIVRPDLSLQVKGLAGVDIITREPLVGYAMGVSLPWLHPTPSIDVISPSLSIGTSHRMSVNEPAFIFRGGVTLFSYNVNSRGTSLLKDTWVGVDIGVATDLGATGGIVLSTRL